MEPKSGTFRTTCGRDVVAAAGRRSHGICLGTDFTVDPASPGRLLLEEALFSVGGACALMQELGLYHQPDLSSDLFLPGFVNFSKLLPLSWYLSYLT